jgi:hypothetical protein
MRVGREGPLSRMSDPGRICRRVRDASAPPRAQRGFGLRHGMRHAVNMPLQFIATRRAWRNWRFRVERRYAPLYRCRLLGLKKLGPRDRLLALRHSDALQLRRHRDGCVNGQ